MKLLKLLNILSFLNIEGKRGKGIALGMGTGEEPPGKRAHHEAMGRYRTWDLLLAKKVFSLKKNILKAVFIVVFSRLESGASRRRQ